MRIIFMGTPAIALPTLEHLLTEGHEIVGVFTQPDRPSGRGNKLAAPPVKEFAVEHNLPVFQPTKIKTPEMHEHFASLQSDLAVVVAYGRILPQHLLDTPRLGCWNVHFSLLPKYRGAAPVNWAIANNEPVTGVTIMQMDAGLDTGDILLQTECWISREDTTVSLGERLARIGADALSAALTAFQAGTLTRTPQDHSQATFAPMLAREDGLIDWTQPAEMIACRIRGFQPWPGGFTTLNGTRVMIWKARSVTSAGLPSGTPGTLVSSTPAGLLIACGEASFLQAEELQLEGRKRLSAKDFMNGLRLSAGMRFGVAPEGEKQSESHA